MACTKVVIAADFVEGGTQLRPWDAIDTPADPVRAILVCLEGFPNVDKARLENLEPLLFAVLAQLEPSERSDEARDVMLRLLASDLPSRLLAVLDLLEFEAQKVVARLFDAVLRLAESLDLASQVETYARGHPQLTELLVEGCSQPEVVLHASLMLRACSRHAALVRMLLEGKAALRLVELAAQPSLEAALDAFTSLRELLLVQKASAAEYLLANFEEFFASFHTLVLSEDYVTQRQAVRLLGELILDHRNFQAVLLRYVGDEAFLKMHMKLLLNESRSIRVGAFHVFKLFVANPNRPHKVHRILARNKERLVRHLSTCFTCGPGDSHATVPAGDLQKILGLLSGLERRLSPPRRKPMPS